MTCILVRMDEWKAGQALVDAASKDAVARRWRASLRFAGKSAAEISKVYGFSPQRLSQWGSGRHYPDFPDILRVLPALGVTLQWLMVGDEAGLSYQDRTRLAALEADERNAPTDGRERRVWLKISQQR